MHGACSGDCAGILGKTALHPADLARLMGEPFRPRTLLIVVKGAHVGSVWLKDIFNLQSPTALFIHEANACAKTVKDVSQLLGSGTCEALNARPAPFGCLSFNTGNFGRGHFGDWEAAARAVLQSRQRPRVLVASLIRTNAAKWAWSVYRHQNTTQEAHVYAAAPGMKQIFPAASGAIRAPPMKQASASTASGAIHAPPVPVDVSDMADRIVAMAKRQRVVQADAVKLAHLLNTTVVSHLTYERLQHDSLREVAHLFKAAGQPFSSAKHRRGTQVLKAAPEDLRLAISNVEELRTHPDLADPCYQAMFVPEAREMRPCDGGLPWLR